MGVEPQGYRSKRAKKKAKAKELKPSEAKYVAELSNDISKGDAARRAGLSHIPNSIAVRRAITAINNEALTVAAINKERVVLQLGRIAFHDPRRLFDDEDNMLPFSQIDSDTIAGIAGFDVEKRTERHGENTETYYVLKPRLRDSVRANEILLKYLTVGMGEKQKTDRLHEIVDAYKAGPLHTATCPCKECVEKRKKA